MRNKLAGPGLRNLLLTVGASAAQDLPSRSSSGSSTKVNALILTLIALAALLVLM